MKINSRLINIFLALMAISWTGSAFSSDIESLFKDMSDIEEPFQVRDPFQPAKLKKAVERESTTPIKEGVFTNVPEATGAPLDKIRITGVLVGPERRAFMKMEGNDDTTYTLKEGMVLGENGAEIKAILPGGLILVEKVTNIYGEVEYLETVIPISK